jgi:AcrR family transcriptional regulator
MKDAVTMGTEDKREEDVRADLLRCALTLLEKNGHESLSVRRVAELAGLSSGAPYYHFADRRALLLGLALEGFSNLHALAIRALDVGGVEPWQTLYALASVFLDFSAAHPELMDLMYESELTRPIDPALEPAYRRAFQMVVGVMRNVHPSVDKSTSLIRAVTFWTSLFGLSRLIRQRLLEPFSGEIEGSWRDTILREVVDKATATA